MRTSKKSQLIQAALEIIDKKSLDALTYDSLAKASGMSKSGLLYHFPSRTALLLALNEQAFSRPREPLPRNYPPANACAPSSKYSHKARPAQTFYWRSILTHAKRVLKSGMRS